jgi:membrane protein implicated in regulation of membrane protease activity
MRIPWKLVGLAGAAGVAATGVAVARKRRAHEDLTPEQLRERLRGRIAEVTQDGAGAGRPGGG